MMNHENGGLFKKMKKKGNLARCMNVYPKHKFEPRFSFKQGLLQQYGGQTNKVCKL